MTDGRGYDVDSPWWYSNRCCSWRGTPAASYDRMPTIDCPADKTRFTDENQAGNCEAFIFRLPNELLIVILEMASTEWPLFGYDCECEMTSDHQTVSALCEVSRRIRRLALPLFYRTYGQKGYALQVYPLTSKAKMLIRRLRELPPIERKCYAISIRIKNNRWNPMENLDKGDTPWLLESLSLLTRLRCLRIWITSDDIGVLVLLKGILSVTPNIKHLNISGREGPHWSSFLELLSKTNPQLQSLGLVGLNKWWKYVPDVLSPKEYRTANFNRLDYRSLSGKMQDFHQVLLWPKFLVHCRIGYLRPTASYDISIPYLTSLLRIHRETLTTLHIGALRSSSPLFRASEFPNLERLAISRLQTNLQIQFSEADADALLAPKLHTFMWDFNYVGDRHYQHFFYFEEDEEQWIRSLAWAAIQREAKLKELVINFVPDLDKDQGAYPWDRMDSIHNDILLHGMTLTYNEPRLTRAEWVERYGDEMEEDLNSLDLH